MAVAKVECPECGKVLKPAKPLTPGKKVRCPSCAGVFTVPGEEDEAAVRQTGIQEAETAPAPKKKVPAKPKAAPPAPKKPDDDDDAGTYGLLKEPGEEKVEEEKKPKIEYAPNLDVTDPRGPATLALAMPSNWIMLIGAIQVVLNLVYLAVATWPWMFTERGTSVTPLEARKKYERDNPKKKSGTQQNQPKKVDKDEAEPEVKFDDLKEPEKEVFEELKDEDIKIRIIWAICAVLGIVFGGIMAFAAVKMQNLESYRWSWAAAIMALFALLSLPFGIMAIVQLKRDEIKEAFEYVPE